MCIHRRSCKVQRPALPSHLRLLMTDWLLWLQDKFQYLTSWGAFCPSVGYISGACWPEDILTGAYLSKNVMSMGIMSLHTPFDLERLKFGTVTHVGQWHVSKNQPCAPQSKGRVTSAPNFWRTQYTPIGIRAANRFCKVTKTVWKATFCRIHHASRPWSGQKILWPTTYAHTCKPRRMLARDLFAVAIYLLVTVSMGA